MLCCFRKSCAVGCDADMPTSEFFAFLVPVAWRRHNLHGRSGLRNTMYSLATRTCNRTPCFADIMLYPTSATATSRKHTNEGNADSAVEHQAPLLISTEQISPANQ